jgi:hypothetical protein
MSEAPKTDKEKAVYWEQKHDALDRMLFSKFGQKDPKVAIDELLREKKAREYYQKIVYHVCQVLDQIDGKKPGRGIVCGTLETPSKEVQERMDEIESQLKWRSMKTVPKDGREVLLKVESRAGIDGKCLVGHYMPGGHCIEDHPPIDEGWYFWNGCNFDLASKPIAWMALPKEEE